MVVVGHRFGRCGHVNCGGNGSCVIGFGVDRSLDKKKRKNVKSFYLFYETR